MDFQAVIFDMDGLLIDSERICQQLFHHTCTDFGFTVDAKLYHQCIGTNDEETRHIFTTTLGPSFPYNDIVDVWMTKYAAAIDNNTIPVKAGAVDLLSHLLDQSIPMAVATSTKKSKAQIKLNNAQLNSYFDFIIGGDEVTHSKPHPEIYNKAAQTLGIETQHCLALEDSNNGVLAAHQAGMKVIQVPDLVAPSDTIIALGHTVVKSLTDVRALLSNTPHYAT